MEILKKYLYLVILICAWDTSLERPWKITFDLQWQCLTLLQFDRVHLCRAYTRSVQFGSILIGSTLSWVRLRCSGFTRTWSHPEWNCSKLDQFHKWIHLVLDTLTDRELIFQIPYKRQGSSVPILYQLQRDPILCKRSLNLHDFWTSTKDH